MTPRPRVAIIGSGFSGIAAAIELKRRGIEEFVIFERAPGLGGTWWHNRYPGAEVDLESHIYSFSFERHDWTRTHAGWKELQQYLEMVVDKWGLREHIRFEQTVESIVWSDTDSTYALHTATGDDHGVFHAVISAVGFLNIPLVPPFARGETEFEGAMCHTSAWIDGLDMTGKSVGILGTGSSAVQVITEAERCAADVKIFQLEPNWLLPKNARDFTATERRLHRNRLVYGWRRFALYARYDMRQWRSKHARSGTRTYRKRHEQSLEFLRTSLASRPDLLEIATPMFPFEGRRTVVSDTYYPSLMQPNVTLIPHGVKELTKTGAVDANGDEHELDIIVMATGFDAANYLGEIEVRGAGGKNLHETWKGEPEAFLGMMVPDFPNFFMMYGPNTNAIPLVSFYEAQASFIVKLIKQLGEGKTTIALKPAAFQRYNRWLQARLRKTIWAGTDNYFRAGTGKIVSQWPFGQSAYIMATRILRRFAVTVR